MTSTTVYNEIATTTITTPSPKPEESMTTTTRLRTVTEYVDIPWYGTVSYFIGLIFLIIIATIVASVSSKYGSLVASFAFLLMSVVLIWKYDVVPSWDWIIYAIAIVCYIGSIYFAFKSHSTNTKILRIQHISMAKNVNKYSAIMQLIGVIATLIFMANAY